MLRLLKLILAQVPICPLLMVFICLATELQSQPTDPNSFLTTRFYDVRLPELTSRKIEESQGVLKIIPREIRQQIDASTEGPCKLTIFGIPSDEPRQLHFIYKYICRESNSQVGQSLNVDSSQPTSKKLRRVTRSIRETGRRLQRISTRKSKKASHKTPIERFLEKNRKISSKQKLAKAQIAGITFVDHPESSLFGAPRKRMSPYHPADSLNDHCLARRLKNKTQKWVCSHYSSGEMGTIMFSELCDYDQELLRNTQLQVFEEALETCCAGAGNTFKNCPSDSSERQTLVLALYLLTL